MSVSSRIRNWPRRVVSDRRLQEKFAELAKTLMAIEIDVNHDLHHHIFSGIAHDKDALDRRDAIGALTALDYFLATLGIDSTVLKQLRRNLLAVEIHGTTSGVFKAPKRAGRKPDLFSVQGSKGRVAGMAFAKMESGMSRSDAALWAARNIPAIVVRQISCKPIHQSTVKEWMEQFGCNLRIRRELKSVSTEDELKDFIRRKTTSNEMTFGEVQCLIMIFAQRKRSANEPPPKWVQLWSEFPE